MELLTFDTYSNKYQGEKEKEFNSKLQTEDDKYTGGRDQIKLVSDLSLRSNQNRI